MSLLNLPARLARLEQRSARDSPADAQMDNVLSLLEQLEESSGQPLGEALHGLACARGFRGESPLRDPDTVPEIDVLTWFSAATGNRRQLSSPLCPLCSTASAG